MNGVPHFEIKKTDLLPPSRLAEFPETPHLPVSENPSPRVVETRRQPGRILPQIDDDVPRNVACRNEDAPGGRVRVVCI